MYRTAILHPISGVGRSLTKVTTKMKPEATNMMVEVATRMGVAYALAVIALTALMMVVAG